MNSADKSPKTSADEGDQLRVRNFYRQRIENIALGDNSRHQGLGVGFRRTPSGVGVHGVLRELETCTWSGLGQADWICTMFQLETKHKNAFRVDLNST